MNFTFPDDKVLQYGTLKNFSIKAGKTVYESINILDPKSNQISIDNTDYFFTNFENDTSSKGGNSIILKLYKSQNIDTNIISYEEPDVILKILKNKKTYRQIFEKKSEKRFKKEVKALKDCKSNNFQNIMKIFHDGECKIFNPEKNKFEEYLYYTMEYAKYDLKSYIEANHNSINLDEKIKLCISLAEGLKELRILGYYHRDIKPDNIFIIEDIWKIGDLGLLDERNSLNDIDNEAEPIGPRGWMSPESMNKYLTEGKGFANKFNCRIEHQSDIFQLGKVYWYIFQHNAPIGSIKESDFKIKRNGIYPVIRTMLNHATNKRYEDIDDVITLLKRIEVQFLKSVEI